MAIDSVFENEWKATLQKIEAIFGEGLDIQAILFLIGVQELGSGPKKFTKDQKVELIHVAICTLLTPFGYYKLNGSDDEGWPHFDNLKPLPPLKSGEQLKLMKDAIIDYFKKY
jgi:hypothetical protein